MKQRLLAIIMLMVIMSYTGCGKTNQNDSGEDATSDFDIVDIEKSPQILIDYNINEILENQKIIFLVVEEIFAEGYFDGYFIDGGGKKHLFVLQREDRYQPVEDDFAYLSEHYDEFEGTDFVDKNTLSRWIDYLYHVNEKSTIKEQGEDIADMEVVTLYGIRMIDGKEEFVWLGSYSGVSKRLDDEIADKLFEELGEDWNRVN